MSLFSKWFGNSNLIKLKREELVYLLPDVEEIHLEDRFYILPSDEEVLRVLGVDNSPYIKEVNDCDDYAYRAKGLACGRGWPFFVLKIEGTNNPVHFINLYVNDKKKVVLLEPKSRLPYDDIIKKYLYLA